MPSRAWNNTDLRFRGSDDDLRARFEEYICAALSTVKYSDFLAKGKAGDISIVGVGKSFSLSLQALGRLYADAIGAESGNPLVPFGEHWLGAFKETKAYTVWDSVTDPVLFDLCEPRSACPPLCRL